MDVLVPSSAPAPEALAGDAGETVRLDVDALRSVLVAAGSDPRRPAMTGVWWHTVDGVGALVATDAYRLHVVDGVPAPAGGVLLPAATMAAAARHASGAVHATIYTLGAHTAVELVDEAGTRWSAECLRDTFPAYRQLLAATGPVVWFTRPGFEDALRDLDATAAAGAGIVLDDSGAGLRLRTCDDQEAEVLLPGVAPPFPIAFNGRYLAELVAGLSTCTLTVTDPLRPMLLDETDEHGRRHRRALIPIRQH